jgi:hypothetical protein
LSTKGPNINLLGLFLWKTLRQLKV